MRKRALALAAALVAVVSSEGIAQKNELERRVDSLARMAMRARGALLAYDDSVRSRASALDTAYAGTPIIVAEGSIVAQTRAIAPPVMDSVETLLGSGMSRLAGHSLRVQVEARVGWARVRDTTQELIVSVIRPNGTPGRTWRSRVDSASMAASLRYAMIYAAFASADPAFFAWANNAIPQDTLKVSDWANQRLRLVSSGSAVGSRCYEGDVQSCKIALLLSPGADPILDWHDSTTRSRIARRHGAQARRMDARAQERCLAGSDSACIGVLRLLPSGTFREPAAAALRVGVLRHALALGGPGSMERLLAANTASVAARLEAAARLPIDSVVGAWRSRVREARAPSEDLTIGIAIMSLAWAAGMGALSLRSSRWR